MRYMDLMQEAWREVDPRGRTLDPDFCTMQEMEEQGLFRVYVLEEQGEQVGYWAIVLSPNMFLRGELTAVNVSLYIKPQYRKAWPELVNTAIKDLEDAEVTDFLINLKQKNRTLEDKGFLEVETVYWRSLCQ